MKKLWHSHLCFHVIIFTDNIIIYYTPYTKNRIPTTQKSQSYTWQLARVSLLREMSLLLREWVEGRLSRSQDKVCSPEEKHFSEHPLRLFGSLMQPT